jgi:hypothetical protein
VRRRRNLETIAGRVNNDGTVAAGSGFNCSNPANGTWVIMFPGFRLLSVNPVPGADFLGYVLTDTYTENTCRVKMYTSAGAVASQPWSFIAVGYQQ